MNYVRLLKEYKTKRAKVNSMLSRIDELSKLLLLDDLSEFSWYSSGRELGMPRAAFRKGGGVVENIVIDESLTKEKVKDLISDSKARVFWINLEVETIEHSLRGLTEKERFIIENKYFECLNWRELEKVYNERFGVLEEIYITDQGLKKIINKVLNCKIIPILSEHFTTYGRV